MKVICACVKSILTLLLEVMVHSHPNELWKQYFIDVMHQNKQLYIDVWQQRIYTLVTIDNCERSFVLMFVYYCAPTGAEPSSQSISVSGTNQILK